MKVKIITADDFHGRQKGNFGSSTIRGYWLDNRWDEASLYTQGAKADVMIYQKVYWKYHMIDFEGIKILDICDPDWKKGEMDLKELSLHCDAITTSTEALAEFCRKIVDIPVVCIPDRVDLKIFKQREHEGRAKQVVWYGYSHNGRYVLQQLLPSLSKRGLSLLVVSDARPEFSNDYGVEVIYNKYEYNTAYQIIQQADICVNPRIPTNNSKYKSNNKTLIAWALGLPVAETLDDLNKFLEADQRTEEIKKRKKELGGKWDIKYSIDQYKELIEQICKKRNIKLS